MLRDEGARLCCRHRVELMRHPTMECCCAVQTLRALRALTCEPCSDREHRPYRKHLRFRRQRRDRDHLLGHRPDEQSHPHLERHRHPEHHLDEVRLRNHLDERHRHQPDVLRQRHLGVLDRRHQPDGDHLDEGRLGDPCPEMVRTDYCLDG